MSVGEIIEGRYSFFIPSYQRGYRWKKAEIAQLLEDIDTHSKNAGYFLQLLAVREDGDRLRIIDGQQRLTTILLILDCIDKTQRCNEIFYETRNGENLLDDHFKCEAKKRISYWLENKEKEIENFRINFKEKLIACEFLYFEIKNEEYEFDFFSRLNTWKISATDSELVKCFFLSNDEPESIEARAIKWNQMERHLSDNQFWGMISNNKIVNDNRMETFLSYVDIGNIDTGKNKENTEERFPLFSAYKKAESTKETKEDLWKKVEDTFSFLRECYGNTTKRHLLGWYFHRKGCQVTKIGTNIFTDVITEIENLRNNICLENPALYCNGGDQLHHYLLLANIAWCSEKYGVDYDFYRHSLVQNWSIEHVHARNQQMLNEIEFKELRFKDDKDINNLWEEYKEKGKEEANTFLQEKLHESCGYPDEDEDNSFGNLALLPKDANSSLNDKLFKGKQREILSWALSGDKSYYWAPPLTVAIFTKEIGSPGDKFTNYWSENDRKSYKEDISKLIETFHNHCNFLCENK